MAKNISKICSFFLLFLFTALALNQFNIISYSHQLEYIFYFFTLLLIMFSASNTLLTNKSGFYKLVSVVIIGCLAIGGVMAIIHPGYNIFLYITIVSISIYSLVDMFYKVN